MKLTFLDVEWANSKNHSICQISVLCKDYDTNDTIYPASNLYVNPEDCFDSICVQIHGITAGKIIDSPIFPVVWKEIEKYFTNSIIVGHNVVSADLSAIAKSLNRYNIEIPEIYYICTLDLARKFISRDSIDSYKLSYLCDYFSIELDKNHDAFYDMYATSVLFERLILQYNINITNFIGLYTPKKFSNFEPYMSNSILKKAITEFYGLIQGITCDQTISQAEINHLVEWKIHYQKYKYNLQISGIIDKLEAILEDEEITSEEAKDLINLLESYFKDSSGSYVTNATQVLSGLLKGIAVDGIITEREGQSLRNWLHDNDFLKGHYPYDTLMLILNQVLEDEFISNKESAYLIATINDLLNPVEAIKQDSLSELEIQDKTICLTGIFSYGQKDEVAKYIISNGGFVSKTVTKKTDILVIGDSECLSYSNGNYGLKIKRAIELNSKGSSIKIVKEKDFFVLLEK